MVHENIRALVDRSTVKGKTKSTIHTAQWQMKSPLISNLTSENYNPTRKRDYLRFNKDKSSYKPLGKWTKDILRKGEIFL